MLFESNQLFAEMRKYVGHNVEIDCYEDKCSLISLNSNETILLVDKETDNTLFEHLSKYAGDEIECAMYGDINIAFQSLDRYEIIVDFEEETEESFA